MNEVMTVAEIKARFDSEWVLLGDPETDPTTNQVQRGALLYHSTDRDEVYRKALDLRPKRFATLYTGKLPKNAVIIL